LVEKLLRQCDPFHRRSPCESTHARDTSHGGILRL
jgi:hypothetical protein